jgi:hypothetical protein
MSSWVSWLTGRGAATKDSTREAIVNLREHLLMLDKKEEYLGKKIDDEVRKARAHATTNPRGQSSFLSEFGRLSGRGGRSRDGVGRESVSRLLHRLIDVPVTPPQSRSRHCDRRRSTSRSWRAFPGGR